MSTDQFDSEQEVRIRFKCAAVDHPVWSERMPRRVAERYIALGSEILSLELAGGLLVLSAAIVPWRFN